MKWLQLIGVFSWCAICFIFALRDSAKRYFGDKDGVELVWPLAVATGAIAAFTGPWYLTGYLAQWAGSVLYIYWKTSKLRRRSGY